MPQHRSNFAIYSFSNHFAKLRRAKFPDLLIILLRFIKIGILPELRDTPDNCRKSVHFVEIYISRKIRNIETSCEHWMERRVGWFGSLKILNVRAVPSPFQGSRNSRIEEPRPLQVRRSGWLASRRRVVSLQLLDRLANLP